MTRLLPLALLLASCSWWKPNPWEQCERHRLRAMEDPVASLDAVGPDTSSFLVGCAVRGLSEEQLAEPETRRRLIHLVRHHPSPSLAGIVATQASAGCRRLQADDRTEPADCKLLRLGPTLLDHQVPPRRFFTEWKDALGLDVVDAPGGFAHVYDVETGVILGPLEVRLRAIRTNGIVPPGVDVASWERVVQEERRPEAEGRRAVWVVMRNEAGEVTGVGHRNADGVEVSD